MFQVLVHTKCWAHMVQKKSSQAGDYDNSKQRFDSKAYKGKVHMKKVLDHIFDMISCFPADAELALDADCHKQCMFAVLG